MLELNVKQSGIRKRVLNVFHQKTRGEKILKRVHEQYLRDDIGCGLNSCRECLVKPGCSLTDLTSEISTTVPLNHALIVDSSTLIKFHHIFESEKFNNIIITQTVWEDVKKSNPLAYKSMHSLCYESPGRNFYVFMDDIHHETHLDRVFGESVEKRLSRSLIECTNYFNKHWASYAIKPFLICTTEEEKERYNMHFDNVLSLQEYVSGMNDPDLNNKVAMYGKEAKNRKKYLFPEHLAHDVIQNGIRSGKFMKAIYQVSRENYGEASLVIDDDTTWFVQGVANNNRAVNGDIVAVELLPVEQWSRPTKFIRMRDVEDVTMKEAGNKEEGSNEENVGNKEEGSNEDNVGNKEEGSNEENVGNKEEGSNEENVGNKEEGSNEENVDPNPKVEDNLPTAKVVGIIKRNWRPYCGIILKPLDQDKTSFRFAPAEKSIPLIRIETKQAELLYDKRVIVSIDNWPRDSKLPFGHYVRTVGCVGDRKTENEVILLENDVPFGPFSEKVLGCLPSLPWKVPKEKHRKDLRSLTIFSIDPPGCTDIDDALHCRQIGRDRYEVGVHIADVSHFLRPGTAMDLEASHRGTSVYLCDNRIDMLPELLSGDLCSLRENVERLAFSVIWTLTKDAEIIDVKFHKSLIRSSAALTYQAAQNKINNLKMDDPITLGLRELLALSKKLKEKRRASGSLTLASSEIRFTMSDETKDPLCVQEKQILDTNSMVEEFMLLANISVAKFISNAYPDCVLLRRHPMPSKESFKTIIKMAKEKGFPMNVESGKALADSLDNAIDSNNPMVNQLFRMLTTHSMTQAIYFCSGTLPPEKYYHFGLAIPIYTHFTSPIRRYADVMVHRLLAAEIGADSTTPEMLDSDFVERIAKKLNYRHKHAQYASRASVSLNTLFYFRGKQECHDGFVMGLRKNGIQVFVPKFGFESVIVFPSDWEYVVDDDALVAEGVMIRTFEKVKVQLSLNEKDVQHIRLDMKLISPKIPGLTIDFIEPEAQIDTVDT